MKIFTSWTTLLALAAAGMLAGCAQTDRAPDVSHNIRQELDRAGFKQVSVSQDRDKGVVTLGGHVASDNDKAQANAIARSIARGEVVANQIAVEPAGVESVTRSVNSDLDKGIEQNLDAALLENRLHDHVKFSVKNQVVTLTGNVDSPERRREAQAIASGVPNVQQVVNELQVKNRKATSTE